MFILISVYEFVYSRFLTKVEVHKFVLLWIMDV
jgi:hypothetical protein